MKRNAKNKEVTFVNQRPQHPRNRLKRITEKLEFDAGTLKEIPYINIDVLVESSESENKIMEHIIHWLLADNDRYYIEDEEGSNTFEMREDPLQTCFNLF